MSATQTSSRAAPTSVPRSGGAFVIGARPSRPLDLRLCPQIDGAPFADIVKMLVHEAPRGTLAAQAQHLEEIIVRGELAEGVEMRTEAFEYDAMNVDAPVFAR